MTRQGAGGVGGGEVVPTTLNGALWEPLVITLTSDPLTYPITMTADLPPEALTTDYVRLQVRSQPSLTEVLNERVVVGTGPIVFPGLSSILSGTHNLRQRMENDTFHDDWSNELEHGPDAVAPVLTSAIGTQTGTTTADLGVTTNEANGTLYYVVTTSATQPSAAQIKAGQNNGGTAAAYAGSQVITTIGAKTASATALAVSTTYYAHYMHEDATANQSNRLTSSSFTTATPASADAAITDARNVAAGYIGGGVYYDWTDIAIGTASVDRHVYAFVHIGEGDVISGVKFNGAAGTKVDELATNNLAVYKSASPVTSGTTCTVGVAAVGNTNQVAVVVGYSKGLSTVTSVDKLAYGFRNNTDHDLSVVTPTGGRSLVFGYAENVVANGTWSATSTFGAGVSRGTTRFEGAHKGDTGTQLVEVTGWGDRNSAMIAVNLGA